MKKSTFFFRLLPITFLVIFTFCIGIAQGQETNLTFAPTHGVAVEYSYLSQLVYNLQPTITLTNEGKLFYGESNFLVVECPPALLPQLYAQDNLFATVELLRIKIESPQDEFLLNLSDLTSFSNLQYVQLIFLYNISEEDLENNFLYNYAVSHVLPKDTHVTVMYQVNAPEY